MKQKYIDLYSDFAHLTARLSHAKRLQVGAVIVKDDTVISYGYNGMPSGWDNLCEDKEYIGDAGSKLNPEEVESQWPLEEWVKEYSRKMRYRLKTKSEVLHAESNAIAKLAKTNNSGDNADIFITHAPCMECSKLIFQSGIRRVYYGSQYRDDAGVKFLQTSGIEVLQLKGAPKNPF